MTEQDWTPVGQALLGSWPTQVATWGREAIAAYCNELRGRGLTPEQALTAIRTHTGAFPPSAGEVAGHALVDPNTPTFDELFQAIYGPRGILRARPQTGSYPNEAAMRAARNDAALERADSLHPLIGKFVRDQGVERLRMLPLDDEEYGELNRQRLRDAWERLCVAHRGRELAALASGAPRTGLRRTDPLTALGLRAPSTDEKEES